MSYKKLVSDSVQQLLKRSYRNLQNLSVTALEDLIIIKDNEKMKQSDLIKNLFYFGHLYSENFQFFLFKVIYISSIHRNFRGNVPKAIRT